MNRKQFFLTLDIIYHERVNAFIGLASRHLYNRDFAIDAVHDAFVKAVIYFNNNPHRKVREEIVNWLILKACKKINKTSREVSTAPDLMDLVITKGDNYEDNDDRSG